MEEIYRFFSYRTWYLVPKTAVEGFIAKYNGQLLTENVSWQEAAEIALKHKLTAKYRSLFIVTEVVGDFVIIEGAFLENDYAVYCEALSAEGSVYRFFTDIWMPVMIFEVYEYGRLLRYYELETQGLELIEREEGVPLAMEQHPFDLPESSIGYECFFQTLVIMREILKIKDLTEMLQLQCRVFIKD